MLPSLSERRQAIGFDQQGHGRTADIDRPLTFEQEADDTAAALRQLGIEQADVFGFSDGGNVGLGLAIRHPGLVRRLVIAGTNANTNGLAPGILDFLAAMTPDDLGDEMRGMYEAEAPRPADWPTLIAKISAQAVAYPGWTADELASITAPTLVIIGDADIVTPEHASEVVRRIPHAHLAVLPLRDHIALVTRPEWMLSMIQEFLDAPLSTPAPA
jgi:pimeloyl-ACP methyl ester carboxylesterase